MDSRQAIPHGGNGQTLNIIKKKQGKQQKCKDDNNKTDQITHYFKHHSADEFTLINQVLDTSLHMQTTSNKKLKKEQIS